jgi:hypothetical protein
MDNMKYLKRLLIVGLATALLACGGGGGDAGTSLYGTGGTTTSGSGSDGTGTSGTTTPTTTATASSIDVLASANTVATAGDQVTITAIVKTSDNVSIASAPVAFSATTGILTPAGTTTDASGAVTAKFWTGPGAAGKSNRIAVIHVTSGSASGSISLPINGSKISVAGSTTVRLGDVTPLTFKAVDSNGNAVATAAVSFSSSLGNTFSPAAGVTDANGQLSITYTAAKVGSDTIVYSGLGAAGTLAFTVSGEDFVFTSPAASAKVPVNTDQTLQVRYRVNGSAVPSQTISFVTTSGVLSASSAVTDASGVASISINAATASPATVVAKIVGGTAQATLPLNFVATVPARLVLQASPTAITPNASGTANQAQVLAKVFDANGNPVSDMTVNFSRNADPSGGQLLSPSAMTDANGQATVQYAAGAQSTASNGVKLHAAVGVNPAVFGDAALTVSQSALFIALGTGNEISNIDPQTYKKDWVVYVTDANGVAVPNVQLTIKAIPVNYRKGRLVYGTSTWGAALWDGVSLDGLGQLKPGAYISCPNEDALLGDVDSRSYNGVLDVGEDVNKNNKLEPGNVISVTPGVLNTDATGRATLSLIYAESYAPWIEINLQVQAIVSGTASTANAVFVVSASAPDFSSATVSPAGAVSPFGVNPSCTVAN